jgi:hypothetical protein
MTGKISLQTAVSSSAESFHFSDLVALKALFGQLHIECHGIAAVKTGFAKIGFRAFEFSGFQKAVDAEIIQGVES